MYQRFLRFCEGMLGRRKLTLEGIKEPAKVHVTGTIASPNSAASPVTVVKAAVITWRLFHRIVHGTSNREQVQYTQFAGDVILPELLIETPHGLVVIEASCPLSITYTTSIAQNSQPLMSRPPSPLAEAIAADNSVSEVYYGERFLQHGDRVALRALVAPLERGAGPYRGGPTKADFQVVTTEPVRLYELDPV